MVLHMYVCGIQTFLSVISSVSHIIMTNVGCDGNGWKFKCGKRKIGCGRMETNTKEYSLRGGEILGLCMCQIVQYSSILLPISFPFHTIYVLRWFGFQTWEYEKILETVKKD